MSSEEPTVVEAMANNDENQENQSPIEYPIPLNVISKIIDCNFQGSYEEDLVKALAKSTVKFITTIASIANKKANALKRKTIHAQDVLEAVVEMGFRDIGYELVNFHAAYKQELETQPKEKRRRSSAKGKGESVDTNPDEEVPAISMEIVNQIHNQINQKIQEYNLLVKSQMQQNPSSSHESESIQGEENEDEDDDDEENDNEEDDDDDEEDDDDDDEDDENGESVDS